MARERTNLLRDATEKRRSISVKCRALCRISCCRLKPETNLALMLCLVFYLYICLGGALFLLLEGQAETPERPDIHRDRMKKLMVSLKLYLFFFSQRHVGYHILQTLIVSWETSVEVLGQQTSFPNFSSSRFSLLVLSIDV